MSSKRARVHMDATKPGGDVRTALCGYICVEVESDVTKVTCKACLARIAGKPAPGAETRGHARGAIPASEMRDTIAAAFRAAQLAPTAGAPPVLTPPLWAASCKGGEERCHDCPLCSWEREAEMWHAVAPWNRKHEIRKPVGAPMWSSLNAALVALANWFAHDRWGPSAMGGIIARLQVGDTGGQPSAKGDDPLMRKAGELVAVYQALDLAYPEGGQRTLSAAQCKAVLLDRTPGVTAQLRTYEELAADVNAELAARQRRGLEARHGQHTEQATQRMFAGIPLPEATPENDQLLGAALATRKVVQDALWLTVDLDVRLGTGPAPVVTVGELQAVVKHGRAVAGEELLRRGLIPRPSLGRSLAHG